MRRALDQSVVIGAACLLIGCHRDTQAHTISGPTAHEHAEAMAASVVMVGADVVIPEVGPLAAQELRTLYHATNAQGEESILNNGINLEKGRLQLDFNPANQKGFYVTQDLEQAQIWANRYGEDGRIVQFKVPQVELDSLNGKIFPQGNDEWLDFVLSGRNGTLQHAFDFVEGPYLKLKDLSAAGHQLAIFTESAVRIFNKSIVK